MKTILLFLLCALPAFGQLTIKNAFYPALVNGVNRSPVPDIFWWRMLEGTGTTVAGSASSGTDSGNTDAGWSTGASSLDYALDFNGSSHVASNSTALNFGGVSSYTIAFWINPDTTNGGVVLELSTNYNNHAGAFLIYKENVWMGFTGTSSGPTYRSETNAPPALGVWTHYLAYFDATAFGDAGNWTVYTNGVLAAMGVRLTSKATTSAVPTQKAYLGQRGTSATLLLNGKLDDVRIYSGDKTGAVESIYNDPQ